jgi:hypothetical protein
MIFKQKLLSHLCLYYGSSGNRTFENISTIKKYEQHDQQESAAFNERDPTRPSNTHWQGTKQENSKAPAG